MVWSQVGDRNGEKRELAFSIVVVDSRMGELFSHLGQRQRGRDRNGQRDGSGHRAQVGETDPYGHRSTGQVCLSKAAGNSVSQIAERLSNEIGRCIPTSEGGLGTDGLRPRRSLHGPLINVGRESRQFCPNGVAEQAAQDRAAGLGQLADGKSQPRAGAALSLVRRPKSARWEAGRERRAHHPEPRHETVRLATCDATLARCLVRATPTDKGSPISSRTRRRIAAAISVGVPKRWTAPATSRNASSMDTRSTRGVKS